MVDPLVLRLLLLALLSTGGAAYAAQSSEDRAPDASAPAAGQAQEAFAGLTVLAYGDQVVDIFTGITTLPEGGQVIDRENGVTLTAQHISYREGEFVEAQEVEVAGEFGTAHADEVYIDLAEGRLDATGEVRYERDDLGLDAMALHYFPAASVVRFEGPVTGLGAEFEAAAALYDGTTGVLVLAAPYRYQDALFELSSDREGALLSLTPNEEGTLVASSRVAPQILERLQPYLALQAPGDSAESSQP